MGNFLKSIAKRNFQNKSNKTSLCDIFQFERKQLTFFGFYPLENETIFYHIKLLIVVFLSMAQTIVMIALLIKETDISIWVNTIYFCATEASYVCKLLNFVLTRHQMKKVEKLIKKETFKYFTEKQERFVEDTVRTYNRFAISYRFLTLNAACGFFITPLTDIGKKKLPVNSWYPFDMDKYYVVKI